MVRRLLRALAVVASLGSGALVANACGSVAPIVLCGEIPNGGCPEGRGGSCDDEACEKIYDCAGGKWLVVATCSNEGGPSDRDAGDGGDASDGGDGGCAMFMFDHTSEIDTCDVNLQNPDCPAAAAEGCLDQACTTGCGDFFLCEPDPMHPTESGVWVDVGYCDDDGGLHDSQGS